MTSTFASRMVFVGTALLASAQVAPAVAQSASFVARRDFPAGWTPHAIALDDFNGDGIIDVAAANRFSSSVSVMLGAGDGTLRTPTSFAIDGSSEAIAVGDVDGNGLPDLVVAVSIANNAVANHVSVLLGNGDGTFQSARSFTAGVSPWHLVISDFNGDARVDLVVANLGNVRCSMGPCTYDSGSISVLLGNGDGTFQSALHFENGSVPTFVAVGDVNDDGAADVAVLDHLNNTAVSVLLGNGDGTFQTRRRFEVGSRPRSTVMADFNNDGALDLATTNESSPSLSILLGNGDGTFEAALQLTYGTRLQIASAGDFNGDSIADLAVANGIVVSLLLGNGDGTFEKVGDFDAGRDNTSVAIGDLNSDGTPDLALGGYNSDSVSILLGRGDGTFRSAPTYGAGSEPYNVVTGDFNGDDAADLAVVNRLSSDVSVLPGNGDGTFQAARHFAVTGLPVSIAVGDFNGDGQRDLATANGHTANVSVLLGDGDGTFGTAQHFAVFDAAHSIATGDFNSDGAADLITGNRGWNGSSISVLLGNGDGTFRTPSWNVNADGNLRTVTVGDLNADGILDLVLADIGTDPNHVVGQLSVRLGRGDGTFQSLPAFDAGPNPSSVAIGDLNGDGIPDLAVANSGPHGVSVLVGNGDGTFQAAVPFGIGTNGSFPTDRSVQIADFNGDGAADLAVAEQEVNHVSVLIGNGDATFQTPSAFGAGARSASVAVADFNGDGKPDLAAGNAGSSSVSVLINDTPFPAPPAFHELAVAREGNGSGVVSSTSTPESWAQIDCGDSCTATYLSGTTVTLTAQADTGSTFAGWSGCDEVSGNVCTVSMNEARWVTATFVLQRFTLQVRKGTLGSGTVTSASSPPSSTQINCGGTCSASYDWNTVVTLTAAPAFGNIFVGWSGCDASSGQMCTVTMTAARSVTATFAGLTLAPRLF